MKKIVELKINQIAVRKEVAMYCDFCGDKQKDAFTSSYDECDNSHKCNMQICFDCVKQLSKRITTPKTN